MKRLIGIAALIMVPVFALAQSFPSKPVRMIVGYAAGGGADVLARLLAPKLADALGQAVTVDNRPGAGSTVAAATLAKAPADGHTIYFSDAGFVTAPAIFRELPYDPIAGFAPIAGVAALPLAFVVHPSVPAVSMAELLALVRSNPGKYSYGTPGVGTLHHLSSELLAKQADLRWTHVPYKGAAPAMTDLIGGQIPIAVTSATAALAQVKGGKLRIVGLTSRARLSGTPDIPTVAEALPGFEVTNDLFMIAPAGTPASAIASLGAALRTVLEQKSIQDGYADQGAIVGWLSGDALEQRIIRDVARWKTIAKEAGIKPE